MQCLVYTKSKHADLTMVGEYKTLVNHYHKLRFCFSRVENTGDNPRHRGSAMLPPRSLSVSINNLLDYIFIILVSNKFIKCLTNNILPSPIWLSSLFDISQLPAWISFFFVNFYFPLLKYDSTNFYEKMRIIKNDEPTQFIYYAIYNSRILRLFLKYLFPILPFMRIV